MVFCSFFNIKKAENLFAYCVFTAKLWAHDDIFGFPNSSELFMAFMGKQFLFFFCFVDFCLFLLFTWASPAKISFKEVLKLIKLIISTFSGVII